MGNTTMQVEDLVLPVSYAFQDEIQVSLTTNDYAASSEGLPRLDRGFFIKSPVAGTFQVITLRQFRKALFNKSYGITLANPLHISNSERNDILQAITADEGKRTIRLAADQYNAEHLVFVEKTGAASNTIYVGIV